jgi:hypothetical protein
MAFLWPLATVAGAVLFSVSGINWYANTKADNIVNSGYAVKCQKHHHKLSGLEARDAINQHEEEKKQASRQGMVLQSGGANREMFAQVSELAKKVATELITQTLPAYKANKKRLELASQMRSLKVKCPTCEHHCGWMVA